MNSVVGKGKYGLHDPVSALVDVFTADVADDASERAQPFVAAFGGSGTDVNFYLDAGMR